MPSPRRQGATDMASPYEQEVPGADRPAGSTGSARLFVIADARPARQTHASSASVSHMNKAFRPGQISAYRDRASEPTARSVGPAQRAPRPPPGTPRDRRPSGSPCERSPGAGQLDRPPVEPHARPRLLKPHNSFSGGSENTRAETIDWSGRRYTDGGPPHLRDPGGPADIVAASSRPVASASSRLGRRIHHDCAGSRRRRAAALRAALRAACSRGWRAARRAAPARRPLTKRAGDRGALLLPAGELAPACRSSIGSRAAAAWRRARPRGLRIVASRSMRATRSGEAMFSNTLSVG